MDSATIVSFCATLIYGALAIAALGGAYWVILLARRIAQKRFASQAAAEAFLTDVGEHLQRRDFAAVEELCDSPGYWAKAVPQLIIVALANRSRGLNKLRRVLAENFEREILADLEYGASWIATIVKSAPMLGLLGTVLGMIAAFGKIAAMQATGTDPSQLADDISIALLTTALGLTVAIPLVLAGAWLQVRLGKFQDSVQEHLGVFLDDLEASMTQAGGE